MRQHRSGGVIRGLIAVGLLASVLSLTDQGQAQTTANGPYYSTPSWDQTLPAATRFVILSNFGGAAVLDRNTGLVWEKSPDTADGTWFDARGSCLSRNIGGQMGWRLPSVHELVSLIDPSVSGLTLPPGHPFTNVQSTFYWSATTTADGPTIAWGVSFGGGNAGNDRKALSAHPSWCVRGGNNADAY